MAVKPLFICENHTVDYDLYINNYLIELLTKDEPIKLDSQYVNDYLGIDDATEGNIRNYNDCPVFTELKNDMKQFAEEICTEIKKHNEVESATVNDSPNHAGISTYIIIKFKLPEEFDSAYVQQKLRTDRQYISHYNSGFNGNDGLGGEYKMIIRLSTHEPSRRRGTSADIYINITGKLFDYFRDRVLYYVKERIDYINNAWKNYKETGQLPEGQTERNHIRKNARNSRRPWITELLYKYIQKSSLKESFGGDRLQATLENEADNVLKYLEACNVKLEDIVNAVEVWFRDKPIYYAQLLAICADCLVDNIIEYTFDGIFDYDLLFDDMLKEI